MAHTQNPLAARLARLDAQVPSNPTTTEKAMYARLRARLVAQYTQTTVYGSGGLPMTVTAR